MDPNEPEFPTEIVTKLKQDVRLGHKMSQDEMNDLFCFGRPSHAEQLQSDWNKTMPARRPRRRPRIVDLAPEVIDATDEVEGSGRGS